jgi:aspartyl-tRNA(Asn)/glutamyl-tRNA(Gln) amidotransferase subunit A
MGSSLDVVGPFATNATDLEIVYNTIKGKDNHDATTVTDDEKENIRKSNLKNKTENIKEGSEVVKNKVIGIPKTFIDADGVSDDIRKNFYETIEKLKAKGYETKEIELSNIEKALSVYYILMFAEVSSNLARFDGVRYGKSVAGETPNESMVKSRTEGLGKEPIRRSLLGTYVLSSGYYDAYYYKAVSAREALKKEFAKVFTEVDYIATPTSPIHAWKFGEKSDPISMYLADIFTVPANIVGVPGVSVPSGKVLETGFENLDYSVQFLANWYDDCGLVSVAKDVEML